MTEDDAPELRDAWYAEVAETLASAPLAASAIVAVDPHQGRVVGATEAGARYLGDPPAATVDELVDAGVLARPDVDRLARRAAEVLRAVDRTARLEVATSWRDSVPVHRAGGRSEVGLDLVVHHRWRVRGDLLLVAIDEGEPGEGPLSWPSTPVDTLHTLYDRDARILAIEPSWEALYPQPERLVGMLVVLITHPEDLAEVLPVAHEVFSGRSDRCEYTVRIATDDGRWVPVHVDLRPMRRDEHGELIFLASHRVVGAEARRLIPAGLLSTRETAVVAALFDGLRLARIAERDQVSIHTLRNQLKSVYRKLDVASQAELLSQYHRPIVLGAPAE